MQDNTMNGAQVAPENVNYNDSVLKKIVNTAATQVDGVLGLGSTLMENLSGVFKDAENTHGVAVNQKNDTLDVDVKLVVEFGKNIPQIATAVEDSIRKSLREMAGLNANDVRVEVVDTMTREEFENKTKQGKSVSNFINEKQEEIEARKEAKKEAVESEAKENQATLMR